MLSGLSQRCNFNPPAIKFLIGGLPVFSPVHLGFPPGRRVRLFRKRQFRDTKPNDKRCNNHPDNSGRMSVR